MTTSCRCCSPGSGSAPRTRCSRRASSSSTGARASSTSPRARWACSPSYITFLELPRRRTTLAIGGCSRLGSAPRCSWRSRSSSSCCACSRTAAPIVRLISTLGLLVVVQSARRAALRQREPPGASRSCPTTRSTGATCSVQEQVLYIIGDHVRRHAPAVGVRQVQPHRSRHHAPPRRTSGRCRRWAGRPTSCRRSPGAWARRSPASPACWSPRSPASRRSRFTLIVTVTAMAAALLGGFRSFPLTLARRHHHRVRRGVRSYAAGSTSRTSSASATSPGIERAIPFLLILLVLVVRGRGLPLRSHVDRPPPRLGSGRDQRAGPAASAPRWCCSCCSR